MSLIEEIQDLKKALEEAKEEKSTKKYRLPFGKKVGKAQKKRNYVTVFIMNENGALDIKKIQIKDQTVLVERVPRLAAAGYIFYWKKNPCIFLPSWSVQPISAKGLSLKSLEDGSNIAGFELLLAAMESTVTKGKLKGKGIIAWVLGIGLAAIIAYAFLTGGG